MNEIKALIGDMEDVKALAGAMDADFREAMHALSIATTALQSIKEHPEHISSVIASRALREIDAILVERTRK